MYCLRHTESVLRAYGLSSELLTPPPPDGMVIRSLLTAVFIAATDWITSCSVFSWEKENRTELRARAVGNPIALMMRLGWTDPVLHAEPGHSRGSVVSD